MPSSLMMTVAVWGAVCVLSSDAEACDMGGDTSWLWTDPQLVARTPEIFVGRLVDVRPSESRAGWRDYLFEVVESIKGAAVPTTRWLGPFAPVDVDYVGAIPRRANYDTACMLRVFFEKGGQYLVFRDAFHPRGYDVVTGDNDAWLVAVRNLAKRELPSPPAPRRR